MYREKSDPSLRLVLKDLMLEYAQRKDKGLSLDMSRGKPGPEQLELSMGLLDILGSGSDTTAEDGTDCRNYGGFEGIPEARRLLGAIMGLSEDEVFIGGGNSLNLMHDLVTFCCLHPLPGCGEAWLPQGEIKFLCPSPGYDRHFAVTQHLGLKLVTVPITAEGPDMDVVERLVKGDASIKGIWCVPKYSNPTGITYTKETVERLAALSPAAGDFRIFWDNAYAIHDLYPDEPDALPNLMDALRRHGNEDMAFQFCSFAKISFGGGGIAAVGASKNNMAYIRKHMSLQLICNDKVNQLRHARFFRDLNGLRAHMAKQAAILRPKFEMVQTVLERDLGGLGITRWTKPRGGYFISLDTLEGCAKRSLALCKEAGVVMTPAGATFPYGKDPTDSNIRIAPTYPNVEELDQAAGLLALCVKIASVERILEERNAAVC